MNQLKEDLRRTLLKNRRQMPEEARRIKSRTITKGILDTVNWGSIGSVHVFESIESLGEVDTRELIAFLKENYPKLKLYHPRKLNNNWQDVDENNNLAIDVAYDLIIVPTLGFDNSLNRLGHGGGHYDKFLAGQKRAHTVGLCFELGHTTQIPVEPFDIRLDSVISEKQIYS